MAVTAAGEQLQESAELLQLGGWKGSLYSCPVSPSLVFSMSQTCMPLQGTGAPELSCHRDCGNVSP